MVGCYLDSLPVQAMRALAGFYPDRPGTFYLPRAAVDPPQELAKMVFPEVERWLAAFNDGKVQKDVAGPNFLNMLVKLRTVLLKLKKKKKKKRSLIVSNTASLTI
jgi:hypothetical protein